MTEFSYVGAVQDALVARLAARPRFMGSKPVPCCVGWPEGGPKAPEHVWVEGKADNWTVQWASTGLNPGEAPQDEEFVLTANFLVTRAVKNFPAIRDATLELVDELATVLRVDYQLGGLVQSAEIVGGKLEEGYAADGIRQCLVEQSVLVKTYLAATSLSDG